MSIYIFFFWFTKTEIENLIGDRDDQPGALKPLNTWFPCIWRLFSRYAGAFARGHLFATSWLCVPLYFTFPVLFLHIHACMTIQVDVMICTHCHLFMVRVCVARASLHPSCNLRIEGYIHVIVPYPVLFVLQREIETWTYLAEFPWGDTSQQNWGTCC